MSDSSEIGKQSLNKMPYGRRCFLVGLKAVDALWDISELPRQSQRTWSRWTDQDGHSLHGWFNVEEKAAIAVADSRGTESTPMRGLMERYHASLPFSDGEREWLRDVYEELWGSPGTLHELCQQESEIVTSGLSRIVTGRELVSRWWRWRRALAVERGSVEDAREVLRETIEATAPTLALPPPYVVLRHSQATQEPENI